MSGRTIQAEAGYNFSFVPNVHNQDPSRSYDAAGNLLSDGVHTYTYDAEGRISTVDGNTQYFYDAEGERVAQGTVGQTPNTDFLYDLDGRLITTVGSNFKMVRTSLYAAGRHWGDYTTGTGSGGGTTQYRVTSDIGSMYFNFDQAGNPIKNCGQGFFGESMSCNPSVDFTETHFVDQKRDQESNLDYMGARYYSSTLGRFMSPDPLGGHLENPQSLNKYAYALNNPLTNTDPTGLDSYLQCDNSSNSCGLAVAGNDKNGQPQWVAVQGTYAANGAFTATQIGNNPDGSGGLVDLTTGTGAYSASVNGSGVQFSNNGGQTSSAGVFDNGTPKTTFQDAGFANGGALSGFSFTLYNSKLEAGQTEAGTFGSSGSLDQARQAIQAAGFHYWPIGTFSDFGSDEFRSPGDPGTGANSGHFILDRGFLPPSAGVPQVGGSMHFGEHNPLFNLQRHFREYQQ